MAAILDSGFEDPPSIPSTFRPTQPLHTSLLQRTAFAPQPSAYYNGNGHYEPIEEPRTPNLPRSGDSVSSSVESRAGGGHAKKRSGGAGADRYGPLGPLADDDTGWGGGGQAGFKGRRL